MWVFVIGIAAVGGLFLMNMHVSPSLATHFRFIC